MEPIQINVVVSLDERTTNFLTNLFGGIAQAPAKPAAPAAPAKPVEPVKPATPAAPTKPAEPAKPAAQAPAATQGSTVTIDALRELAMQKMNTHRAEIRQKLDELQSTSLTKLDSSKYQEMYDFLNSLS